MLDETNARFCCRQTEYMCLADVKHWGVCSGIAAPGHSWAFAHVKFAGARVKIMWKAKVKDQVLVCAIASFTWTWSEHTGKTEWMVFKAKNGLRSNFRVNNWKKILLRDHAPRSPSRCVLRTHWVCPCCTHVTCSSWLHHWVCRPSCSSAGDYFQDLQASDTDSYIKLC